MKRLMKNPIFSEHLKIGECGIIACLGTYKQFEASDDILSETLLSPSFDGSKFVDDINFYANPEEIEKNGLMSAGEETYVISRTSRRDKMTRYMYDCTSVIVSGKDRRSGLLISFVTHQNPMAFLLGEKYDVQFENHLSKKLLEIRKKCEKGTIDAVIAGGHYFLDEVDEKQAKKTRERYVGSIRLLSGILSGILGFEPVVIAGPKMSDGSDSLLYLNDSRRLFLVRPKVGNSTAESFIPKDLEEQEKKFI